MREIGIEEHCAQGSLRIGLNAKNSAKKEGSGRLELQNDPLGFRHRIVDSAGRS